MLISLRNLIETREDLKHKESIMTKLAITTDNAVDPKKFAQVIVANIIMEKLIDDRKSELRFSDQLENVIAITNS